MTHYGTWLTYDGTGRLALAAILLGAAGGITYAATRLRRPLKLPTVSRAVSVLMVLAWAVALGTFAVGLSVYIHQLIHDNLVKAPPSDPITPVTALAAVVVFVGVLVVGAAERPGARLASAVIAAMAAPMIFELPFDLIVMARTYPAIAPDPALYRAWFFVPLFLVEITTLSLLLLSPMVRVSRASLYFLALMFVVFAIWGLFGFGYPSAPFPIAANVVSKLAAFAAALSLFVPHWAPGRRAGRRPADAPARTWSGLLQDADTPG